MKINPYAEIIIATIFMGLNGVLAKISGLPATSVAWFRSAIPFVFIGTYIILRHRNVAKISRTMLIASFINAIRLGLFYYGIILTYVNLGIVTLCTYPIFTAIISKKYLKEKTHKKTPFIILAFIGVATIYFQKTILQPHDYIGLSLILIAAFLTAVCYMLYKKESHKYTSQEITVYQNLIAAVAFLPFLLFTRPHATLIQWGWGLILGLSVGVIAYILVFSALKKIEAYKTTAILYIEVLTAAIFSFLILKEPITINFVIGGLLILYASYNVARK